MYKIWAFEQQQLIDYQTKIENATSEEIKAAFSIFGKDSTPNILTILGEKAQIKIHGPLSQNGPSSIARFFGFNGTGYLQIIEAIDEISENEQIKKVELLMNTPGGSILGVDPVFQAVKELTEKTEVIAINQGLLASAGYWIASATSKIISESPVNLTGSIGVFITAVDWKDFDKKMGRREVTIVSRNAPNKNPDISKKSGITELQNNVDALERVFIGRIAEGRNLSVEHIKKNFGRGGILVSLDPGGTDAIDVKMIDEVITGKNNKEKKGNIKVVLKPAPYNSEIIKIVNTPASSAGKNKQEVIMPTLKEFLAENPTAQAEYNAALEEKHKAGVDAGKAGIMENIKKVSPFLLSEGYDSAIKQVAVKALTGEIEIGAFLAMIALEDARQAGKKSEQAKDETDKIGDIQPDPTNIGGNASGEIKTEADFQAEVKRFKGVK